MASKILTDLFEAIKTPWGATFTVPEEHWFPGEEERIPIKEWYAHGLETRLFVSPGIGTGKTHVSTTVGSEEFSDLLYITTTGDVLVIEAKADPIPKFPTVPTVVNTLTTMREIYKWQSMQRHAAYQRTLQMALNQQKDYYEGLIEDIEKFRRAEFNAVFYGALASGVAIILISIIARLWG